MDHILSQINPCQTLKIKVQIHVYYPPICVEAPSVCSCGAPLFCLHEHAAVALCVLCNYDHFSGDIMLLTTDIC
jgi:hypothetical protein